MRILVLAFAVLVSACAGRPSLDDPALSSRALNLEEFFDGELRAWGQFQDRFGTVGRRFTVDIEGDWDGERLMLTEDFTYEDGGTERRVWTLRKTGDQTWEGSAPGVIGTASGEERGDAFNWRYTIDLPVPAADGPADTVRVSFDDWMWLVSGDRVLNRAYMSRFGVGLGDVVIFFEKRR
jgi:hypothetical protein